MSVLSTAVKAKAGAKAVKGAAKNPGVVRFGAQASKPVVKLRVKTPLAKRGARRRFEHFGETARDFGETLVAYGPSAAAELGLVEAPKAKRTAPRLVAGAVLGAGAVYFLEPESGPAHRDKVKDLVS
jgi:hypothetical protein